MRWLEGERLEGEASFVDGGRVERYLGIERDDFDVSDDDMIDEDELMTEEDLMRPIQQRESRQCPQFSSITLCRAPD